MQKLKCICCDTEIIPIHTEIIPEDQPYSGMYKNGTVDCLYANYASEHDLKKFVVSICDDCITKKLETGHLIKICDDWTEEKSNIVNKKL